MGPFRGLPLGLPSEFEVEIPNAHPGWIWLFLADVGSLRLEGGALSTPDAGYKTNHCLTPARTPCNQFSQARSRVKKRFYLPLAR